MLKVVRKREMEIQYKATIYDEVWLWFHCHWLSIYIWFTFCQCYCCCYVVWVLFFLCFLEVSLLFMQERMTLYSNFFALIDVFARWWWYQNLCKMFWNKTTFIRVILIYFHWKFIFFIRFSFFFIFNFSFTILKFTFQK